MDLSESKLEKVNVIESSIFDSSKVSRDLFYSGVKISGSSFCDMDLSTVEVREWFFTDYESASPHVNKTNAVDTVFANTGLKIKLWEVSSEVKTRYATYKRLKNNGGNLDWDERTQLSGLEHDLSGILPVLRGYDAVGDLIRKGYLDGCYVNGKKIQTPVESKISAATKAKEYEEYKEQYLNSVVEGVRSQIKSFKRK